MNQFFTELKRRHVYRVAVAYAVVAWLLLQLGAIVFPALRAPDWCERVLLGFLVLGFPVALLLAWAFEATPDGMRRTESAVSEEARPAETGRRIGRRLDFVIIAVLAAAVGVLAWGLTLEPPAASRPSAVVAVSGAPADHAAAPASAIPEKSVAVLPLANESGDPGQRYFSDGLSEELISDLTQIKGLKVIGKYSSFRFRDSNAGPAQIGAALGVANLIQGSVFQRGDRIRVIVNLIRAKDGSSLWSHSYDGQLKDVFAIQTRIGQAVAAALKIELLGKTIVSGDKPPGGNLDAYNALLQGNFYAARRTRADYEKAVHYYGEAIRLDPDYALAYAQLAIVEQWFIDWVANGPGERDATRLLARANALKAVALNPRLAQAQGALGVTQAWSDLDIPTAEATMKTAVAMDTSNAQNVYQLAEMTASLGRAGDAVALIRKALKLEPLNATYHFSEGWYLLSLGRLEEAGKEFNRAINLQPAAVGYHYFLSILQIQRNRPTKALTEARAEPGAGQRRSALALAWFALGNRVKADAALAEMIRMDAGFRPVAIAAVYAYRGETDQAFAWLDRGWEARDPTVTTILYYPFIVPVLHDDPRFAAFCRKVGLPAPAEASAAATQSVHRAER